LEPELSALRGKKALFNKDLEDVKGEHTIGNGACYHPAANVSGAPQTAGIRGYDEIFAHPSWTAG
jgi:hypothetical protein